ncbi:acetyl-CoA synthetase family protein [Oceanibaculum indicum P24]|uniref:Acetyl-CoA synthetase family protein n=2 Tax=Oceanibaculaceae TaxID=3031147 RepID=K2JPZ5_9PROT|nr:acetyl-CoA synthetase family protein [Oceanibaculum indicum P24]
MESYEAARDAFRWDVPESFNFGGDVIDAWARERPDHPALIWCDDQGNERRLTYADIAELSNRVANALSARGVKRGDRVIVMLPRIPEWQMAMVGCLKLGAIPIPCIDMLTERDIAYRLANSEATGAITTLSNIGKFASGDHLLASLSVGGAEGHWEDFDVALADASDRFQPARLAADEPAIMYYTSGSTGHPKGVLHASRGIFAWRVSAWYWLTLTPEDVMWCTADTGWSKAGTSIIFGPWSCGSTVVFYNGRYDPKLRLETLARYRVTVFCAAATELRRLVQEDVAGYDLSALRMTVSAGESVNPEIVRGWKRLTGVDLLDGYGQTETLMTVLNYPPLPVKPGSMGKPLPGTEAAVIDMEGRFAPAGTPGRLAIRADNPQIMLGYWKEPERTAANYMKIGGADWFLTGDLARMDEDGYLFYEGRSDDVINSAGYRIGPMEVENVLMEHEAVAECAVVASPHEERGEVVKAFIVLKAGHVGEDALVKQLQDHCKALTGPYKYPRRIEFTADLPKTASGKIKRRELRDREFAAQSFLAKKEDA